MKENLIFIGIDVSKLKLDICVISNQGLEPFEIRNNPNSITRLFKQLIKNYPEGKLLVCMESTGYYNWPCYQSLKELELELYVINALHMKRSFGLVRGKNDLIDAERIARFIKLHNKNLHPFIFTRQIIRKIQALIAYRNRLIKSKVKFKVPCKELEFLGEKNLAKEVKKSSQKIIREIQKQIHEIEIKLSEIIQNDIELNQTYKYITSVQGVGKVLAWNILVKTNEFKSINNPRKLACYAGVVPFEFQSGSSIYRRPRVSYIADKSLKKLLHLSAMRAVRLEGDLQKYYLRKVDEGKNKMLVLNNVRNKIVARICSVVNNQIIYQNNLVLS